MVVDSIYSRNNCIVSRGESIALLLGDVRLEVDNFYVIPCNFHTHKIVYFNICKIKNDMSDEKKPVILHDMEGDPIGQKTSVWDILPILIIVGLFLIVMVLYFWALQSAVSGG